MLLKRNQKKRRKEGPRDYYSLLFNLIIRAWVKLSGPTKIPTIVIAGVTVPNTPIVQAAQVYARAHADDMTFNHIMRSWLFGAIIINKNATLSSTIEPETLAVAVWDNTGALISTDKRFEVDGAIAAWDFIDSAVTNGTAHGWDEYRKQLVWDSIVLHTDPSIFQYKQPVVKTTATGIFADFQGPNSDLSHTLTWDEYYQVKDAFPRLDIGPSVTRIICGFARTKPATTYSKISRTSALTDKLG
ncbi:uncharacterized protein PAC_06722 [Phialocephala subalpina]|uniref:Uncharacterized protein n=1 Tax=Phialocephala subalpina TaxID=576137 RepID=A0A1L7WVR8_9HELO|nr:uncharacterized protein PAC_06722 [Phialocephala subalpina]